MWGKGQQLRGLSRYVKGCGGPFCFSDTCLTFSCIALAFSCMHACFVMHYALSIRHGQWPILLHNALRIRHTALRIRGWQGVCFACKEHALHGPSNSGAAPRGATSTVSPHPPLTFACRKWSGTQREVARAPVVSALPCYKIPSHLQPPLPR